MHNAELFVVWKMHDRFGDPFPISGAVTEAEAEKIFAAADKADGDCTLWILPVGRKPFETNTWSS